MDVIGPLWFEEQDPEPFPPAGHEKKTGKRAEAYKWKEWQMWVLMFKPRNTSGESPKIDLKWKYSSNTRKPLIEPQTHNELVMVKSMSNRCR